MVAVREGWPGLCPEALAAWLWQGAAERSVAEAGLEAGIAEGARHGAVLRAVRVLARAGLELDGVGVALRARWPGSVDMAVMAVDLASLSRRGEALAALEALVAQVPERVAALARARRRHGDLAGARAAVAGVNGEGALRAALALEDRAFEDAAREIAALGAAGAGLKVRLLWLRDGAAGLAEHDMGQGGAAALCDLWLREHDVPRAEAALRAWRVAGGEPAALRRAEWRLMLARGEAVAVRAALVAELDHEAPWLWGAADHALWLRSGLASDTPAADLARHAAGARRLFARHEGLLHLHLVCEEAVSDWRALPPEVTPDAGGALVLARANLRLGLPGRATWQIARVRRHGHDARACALRAEGLISAGRLDAAATLLARVDADSAPAQADLAALRADLALRQRAPARALAVLGPVLEQFPSRPALWLLRAQAAFALGDFAAAQAALSRHGALSSTAAPDPRARLVAEGPARHAAHMLLQRANWPFVPTPGAAIPRQIIHYWEGPESPALARSRARWAALHPDFAQRTFDAVQAAAWLQAQGFADLASRFADLPGAALRADLFRLCIILREGGVFADLDEYPRVPITPWLEGAQAVLCVERGFGTVANNFIAATPGQDVIARALDGARSALAGTAQPCPWWDTGPAQLARAVVSAFQHGAPPPGLRLLAQAAYDRRVSTNLPWPHKRGAAHWRNAGPVDSAAGCA